METLNETITLLRGIKSNKREADEIETRLTELLPSVEVWLLNDLINVLIESLGATANGNAKKVALRILTLLPPAQLKNRLTDLIPAVCSTVSDTNKAVKENSLACMETLVRCNGNMDLEPFLPKLMESLTDLTKTKDTIEDLASCIFVQNVEACHLAVIIPVLKRGLRDRAYEVQRKSCVIIENVTRLVEEPKELVAVMPDIFPLVQHCSEHISNPEARRIAGRALQALNEAYDVKYLVPPKTTEEVAAVIAQYAAPKNPEFNVALHGETIVAVVKNLTNSFHYKLSEWERVFRAYLQWDEDLSVCRDIWNEMKVLSVPKDLQFVDTEEGADLYKGDFSLAYGTLTLLRNTQLHLKRNRFYGLLGPNNCGKTTLMRAISNEQIEGFPKRDELKTIFVEHEIQEREVGEDDKGYPIFNIDLSGIGWIVDYCNNVCNMQPPVTEDQVTQVMIDIGFGRTTDRGERRAADADRPVTTYSGGWKMKMQLCAATLLDADILMLDEPTGHLDVRNIAWLKGWLHDFLAKGGSIITTSHDSAFLNEMCTHIIDFQKRRLVTFRGDRGRGDVLRQFVEMFPEKQGYFELKNDVVRFTFPEPGYLEGVKSMSKALLKMTKVTFQYPTRDQPTVADISLECSRISRVAVIGPNGAGKSTAIKLFVGELAPTSGTIVKHPNMRVAYVAQHAFFHLEKHLTKTPTQYIMWRFAGNEDKEGIELINKKDEEETATTKFFIKGDQLAECRSPAEEKVAVQPEMILNRHENKKEKTKEYEVKWVGRSEAQNMYVARDILIAMGAKKMVQKFDEKIAAERGLMFRPLTSKAIEEHCLNFGIEPEQASHTLIRSLSGGQKIKVVMAAAMWQNPHVIILDEPTNYLDRDSLGALVNAIEEFKGGVIIISHNREFADRVAPEKWIMEGGRLRREGQSVDKEIEDVATEAPSVVIDEFGNEIQIDKSKTMTAKEKKQEIKKIEKQLKEAKKKKTMTEDQMLDLEIKLDELKKEVA